MTVFDSFNEFWKGSGKHTWGTNSAGDDIVPNWYFAIIILCFIGGIIGAIALGSYVNGAKWINKKNVRIQNQEFKRSTTQQLVYKLVMPLLALLILFMGYMGSIDGTLNIYKNQDTNENQRMAFIPFFRSQGSLLYQCNIASIFIIPWLMFFNKTKAIAIVAPFTFIGAATTVFSQTDLADGKWFDGFEVHRKAIEHIMIMVVPIFVLVANRFHLTTKSLVGSFIYIALMNAILAFAVYFGWSTHFDKTHADFGKEIGAGEFFKAASMLGLDGRYVAEHYWITIVFILGPLTFLMATALWLVYNLAFYASVNKIDTSKIKIVKVKSVIIPARKIAFKNKFIITKKPIDLGKVAELLIWFFQALTLKIVAGPVLFFKNFRLAEKSAWENWLKAKNEQSAEQVSLTKINKEER